MGAQPGKATNDPNGYLAFGKQTAKGTEASTFTFPKHLDGSGFEVQFDVQSEHEGGDGQEVGLRYRSMVKADGALSVNARPAIAARIFAAVLGLDAIGTAGVASLARHTASPQASLPYFTVEQRFADEIERAADCVWTGFTLEGEAGKPFKVSGNYISGATVYQRDIASTLTPAREKGDPIFYAQGSYQFDGNSSYATDFTRIRVEVSRGVDDNIQTTGLGRDDVVPETIEATVEGTLKYTSRDFYQKVTYNGGSVPVSLLATGSVRLTQFVQAMTASGLFASSMMDVQLPLITWTDAKVNKLDPDGKTVYLDVVGMSIKGATVPVFTTVDNNELAAY